MENNKTFLPSNNTNHNALIGDECFGDKDYIYQWGFATSVDILLNTALTNDFIEDIESGRPINITKDAIIYPILFCARHHIELHLKMHITRVCALREVEIDNTNTHKLSTLYDQLVDTCEKTDSRILKFVTPLSEYIQDYDKLDETGQVFRYPRSNEDEPHLRGQRLIDLLTVKRRWDEMRNLMDELAIYIHDFFIPEYEANTLTEKLNRQELFSLAAQLPDYSTWADTGRELLLKIKKEWMDSKNISGRDFTKAINQIKLKPFLSHLIGIEKPLAEITQETIHKMLKVKNGESTNKISIMEWHAISAIYECESHIYMPEEYFISIAAAASNEQAYIDPTHVMRKLCWHPHRFLDGLTKLGQHSLAKTFNEIQDQFHIPRDVPTSQSGNFEQFLNRRFKK